MLVLAAFLSGIVLTLITACIAFAGQQGWQRMYALWWRLLRSRKSTRLWLPVIAALLMFPCLERSLPAQRVDKGEWVAGAVGNVGLRLPWPGLRKDFVGRTVESFLIFNTGSLVYEQFFDPYHLDNVQQGRYDVRDRAVGWLITEVVLDLWKLSRKLY